MARPLIALGAIVAALILIIGDLQARPSGGSSFGSRGSRTYSAPPTTRTAPNTVSPMERSATQATSPTRTTGLNQNGFGSGLFSRPGLMGGLFAGFLGAGLLGLLFGHGLFGGLGGLASVLGLLIQIALVVIVARLAWAWWQRRQQGLATASGPSLRVASNPTGPNVAGSFASVAAFGGKVTVEQNDYDMFERLLYDVSYAYGAEDLARLRALVTPEMLDYFSEQIAANTSRGALNKVSGLKLLQGDLSEAWREGDQEYATVAMRYAITDATIDRATGHVIEGSQTPQEVTEAWTFVRPRGTTWVLSAIQQAS